MLFRQNHITIVDASSQKVQFTVCNKKITFFGVKKGLTMILSQKTKVSLQSIESLKNSPLAGKKLKDTNQI